MTDYIRKGVELADGWSISNDPVYSKGLGDYIDPPDGLVNCYVKTVHPVTLDGLAAQLRSQAQRDPYTAFRISIVDSAVFVEMIIYNPNGDEEADPLRFVGHEENEAMAFIKAIVDSGVLEQ